MLFLLYHYFAAAEMYNMIRVLIAAYVWMTGFNNFLYYYKTNDFSIVRSAPLPANERSSIRWGLTPLPAGADQTHDVQSVGLSASQSSQTDYSSRVF